MVKVTIEMGVFKLNLAEKMPQIKERGLQYATQGMIRALMINSPVDTGHLRQWAATDISSDEVHIRSPAKYAKFVNDGTRPYTIHPVNKQALFWPGADHPVKFVNHPGIKGQHFVEDSINDVKPQLDGFFMKAIREVLG